MFTLSYGRGFGNSTSTVVPRASPPSGADLIPMAGILLAEDDSSLRAFLSKALGKAGHMVTSCEDGVEAIAALELREYDVLLADIVMPGIDGIELAQRATAHLPDIKCCLSPALPPWP